MKSFLFGNHFFAMPILSSARFGVVFILLIIVPATVLSFFSLHSLTKESAYLEQQVQSGLKEEVRHGHSSVNQLLKRMHHELDGYFSEEAGGEHLKEKSPYAGIIFKLSKDRQFLLPDPAALSYPEQEFVSSTKNFFNDTVPVPVYSGRYQADTSPTQEAYNVNTDPQPSGKIFFSQIIAGHTSGTIPLILNGENQLLFWKAWSDGQIVGCLIDKGHFKKEMSDILPQAVTESRILTVLDDTARPIVLVDGMGYRDWRQTYLSKEISRALPNWKIAVYLINPQAISLQANRFSKIIQFIILMMFLVIALGCLLVYNFLTEKMRLAQQRIAFAINVSHELRTPLTSIQMFAQMLVEKKGESHKKQEQYLQFILSETGRLKHLVNHLLDFSSLENKHHRYQKESIDIIKLCRDLVESQRLRLETLGFTVQFYSVAESVLVWADQEAIKQSLLNLLTNAEKYSLEQKEMSLYIHVVGKFVMIDVKDEGVGITKEERERIFEEFYRIDAPVNTKIQGTGLGLTMARKIIRDHKGDLLCLAAVKGAFFRIQLPIQKFLK